MAIWVKILCVNMIGSFIRPAARFFISASASQQAGVADSSRGSCCQLPMIIMCAASATRKLSVCASVLRGVFLRIFQHGGI